MNDSYNYEYKKAEKSDAEILTKLLMNVYEGDTYINLLKVIKDCFKNGREVFYLAYNRGKPIGAVHGALRSEYVNGKQYDGTAGYLEGIYVCPKYRLHGVAYALVALVEEWSRQNGCLEFLSDCLLENTDSYKFHLRLGFTETERNIFFRKEL